MTTNLKPSQLDQIIMNETAAPALPVAPEFVKCLQEQTLYALRKCLETTCLPDVAFALLDDLFNLSYYLEECYRDPKSLIGEYAFDGAKHTIDTINHLAEVGYVFEGEETSSLPRKGTLLAEKENA